MLTLSAVPGFAAARVSAAFSRSLSATPWRVILSIAARITERCVPVESLHEQVTLSSVLTTVSVVVSVPARGKKYVL